MQVFARKEAGPTPGSVAVVTPYAIANAGGVTGSATMIVEWLRRQGITADLFGAALPGSSADTKYFVPVPSFVVTLRTNGSLARLAIPLNPWRLRDLISPYQVLYVHEPALPLSQAALAVSRSANVGNYARLQRGSAPV